MTKFSDAIGGYFPLELPRLQAHFYPNLALFSSARGAFYALLVSGKPDAVWVPRYICDAMLSPLETLQIPVKYYSLDSQLMPDSEVAPAQNEWLLWVNYFGSCDVQEQKMLARFNPRQLILDHSQAFYSPPGDCLATLYSPRKFFGVPDGGLLATSLPVDVPQTDPLVSLNRSAHLLRRLAENAESGFATYQQAEETFTQAPSAMSQLTETLLKTIDYQQCRKARNENFQFLHQHLGRFNEAAFDKAAANGALCYPFLNRTSGLRQFLTNERIYTPSYWHDAARRVMPSGIESDFIHHLIPLPVDQRYGIAEMEFIVEKVADFLNPSAGV